MYSKKTILSIQNTVNMAAGSLRSLKIRALFDIIISVTVRLFLDTDNVTMEDLS